MKQAVQILKTQKILALGFKDVTRMIERREKTPTILFVLNVCPIIKDQLVAACKFIENCRVVVLPKYQMAYMCEMFGGLKNLTAFGLQSGDLDFQKLEVSTDWDKLANLLDKADNNKWVREDAEEEGLTLD